MRRFGKGLVGAILLGIASYSKPVFTALFVTLGAIWGWIVGGVIALVFLGLLIANVFCFGWLLELVFGRKRVK